jgi:hypothetical protein
MLSGAPPPTLDKSLVARHNQTWRLHEYHLLLPEDLSASAETAEVLEDPRYKPLSPGDPLRAYLPHGLALEQDYENDGIRVHEPGRVEDTLYHRCPTPEQITAEYAKRIREILIKGQVSTHQQPSCVLFPLLGLTKATASITYHVLSFLSYLTGAFFVG